LKIIYTCITNGYDEIPNEHYYDPDIQYVCFTDGTIEKKGPWEFREIPFEHECPRRLSAYPKINPHKLFPVGSQVAWIDGCYVMTKKFAEVSKQLLDDHPFAIMRHTHRFTFYDEILEGYLGNMNTWEDQVTMTKLMKEKGYNFRLYDSPVLGSFWRNITEDLFEFHDLWWKYSLIGPNRDQLSFDLARQITGLKYHVEEDGWLGKKSYLHGWDICDEVPGSVGVLFGSKGKQYRKKLHPQSGCFDSSMTHEQLTKKGDELVKHLFQYTKLHPKFYKRYHHIGWMNFNVLDPSLPKST
tara:strand:+ start:2546 stop:3439 length:894 start_codon:yes stop_codon:yes gene_type:complete